MLTNDDKYKLYRPKKFLGQNFLVDENIAKKIITFLDVKAGETVIEIGPGQGVLTKYLAQLKSDFHAVEIDKYIFEKLSAEYGESIKLIHKDFLKLDLDKDIVNRGKKIKIIGNIPYNITTEILFKLYDHSVKIDSAVLMMQKEVALRLTAKPDTKEYGILAVQTQIHASPKILYSVPPSAFFPKPNVNSSVVRLEFINDKYDLIDKVFFKKLVKAGFGQRRKTLRNSLRSLFEDNCISFDETDFDFSRRPENLRVTEFVNLSNDISKLIKTNLKR